MRMVLLWLLLLFVAPGGSGLLLRSRAGSGVRRGCLPLPEEILEQMYGRLSVGVLSAFHHALELQPGEPRNLSCPSAAWASGTTGTTQQPVNLLSISPWSYRMTFDPLRYPRSLPEAFCLCRGCLLGPYGAETTDFHSVPVLAPVVVLRRGGPCVGGRFSYSEHYTTLAVGCTCVPAQELEAQEEEEEPRGNAI